MTYIAGPGASGSGAAGPGAAVRLRGVERRFGQVRAVAGVDLEVAQSEMLSLLGPSGCGKTTLLRLIAGFEAPDAGVVEIGGRVMAGRGGSVPPERRNVGVVVQEFALFPHLNVADNVAYGIHRDPDRAVRVAELLDLVGLADQARRMPHELSGGMKQRVALARALAPRPGVILLDEPFSNLDQALRTRLRAEVRGILRAAGATAVFVTHDQDEALTIADRVCVMVAGRIEQCATPELLYAQPATPFVATFVGVSNLLPGDAHLGIALTRLGPVRLVATARTRPEGRCLVAIRPEQIALNETPDGGASAGAWRVVDRRFAGTEILLQVAAPDGVTVWAAPGPALRRLQPGDAVQPSLRDSEAVAFASAKANAAPVAAQEAPADVARDGDPADSVVDESPLRS